MANLIELKGLKEAALSKAEGFVASAESANRAMTPEELSGFNAAKQEVDGLNARIAPIEAANTLRLLNPKGQVIPSTQGQAAQEADDDAPKPFSKEYAKEFRKWAGSKGLLVGASMNDHADELGGFKFPARSNGRASAALYESLTTAGGFAVPSQVVGDFVPLAPPEFGVQKLATVIPTSFDLKFPRKTAFGTAALKAESGATNNAFTGTDPAIDQFTLSAFMVGHPENASWELLQDVPAFQAFISADILLSIAILKENLFINGTGTGQPQGLLGNVGAGATGETADSNGNLLSINALRDVQGVLNAYYHQGASWLMSRASSISIRKAQTQANLFNPVFTRVGGQDFIDGYPVEYSSAMPAIAAGATPVLFGNFADGYLIGERGGAGINIKILDQPLALQGLLQVLGYQRVDGRVRRSEAIQAITLHT